MVACHNEESINIAIDGMRELKILPQEGVVTFGQTYGLSDYITKWLGKLNAWAVYELQAGLYLLINILYFNGVVV